MLPLFSWSRLIRNTNLIHFTGYEWFIIVLFCNYYIFVSVVTITITDSTHHIVLQPSLRPSAVQPAGGGCGGGGGDGEGAGLLRHHPQPQQPVLAHHPGGHLLRYGAPPAVAAPWWPGRVTASPCFLFFFFLFFPESIPVTAENASHVVR